MLKDIFGAPNTGVHSYRFFGLAAVDLFGTILIALILKYYFKKYNFFLILGTLFIAGIVLHRLFGVRTKIGNILFNN